MTTHLAVAFATAILPAIAQAQGITLTVEGVRNDRGYVLIAVFDKAHAFDQLRFAKAVDFAEVPARKGEVVALFPRLTAGPYAIFLFHDENGDEDLNYTSTAWLEGIGATGAPNPEDEPSFEDAAVLSGPVRVKLHYDQ